MKRLIVCLLVAFLGSGLALAATGAYQAADVPGSERVSPVVLARSQQWDMHSQATGATYRISVSLPKQAAPAGGYPVLYVLDAGKMFLMAVETVRNYEHRPDIAPAATPFVVVGIGYPPGTDVAKARTRDLTPPAREEDPRLRSPGGGADRFLEFLENELKPDIERRFTIDGDHQALLGHSFGGLFVLYTLTTKPDSFQTYLAASASLWYAHRMQLRRLAAFAKQYSNSAKPIRALLTVGEYEGSLAPWAHRRGRNTPKSLKRMNQVGNIREATQLLDQNKNITARFEEIMGADHGTVVPAAISRAVQFLKAPPADSLKVPAEPSAKEYVSMTPEQRYRLRMEVRRLPDEVRIPWLKHLKATLENGLSPEQHKALDVERNLMDKVHGTMPRAVNAGE